MSDPGTSSGATRRALITGAAGQDGSYLAELLVAKGYTVDGIVASDPQGERPTLAAVRDRITLHDTDLSNAAAVSEMIARLRPDEVYNLAAPSVVGASWGNPPATVGLMVGSVVNLLDAMATHTPEARYFQAASSEIFRGTGTSPQNENTRPAPTSPYGVAKLAGHNLVAAYREHHGLHASSGILYKHESPRRPIDFVPAKIVNGAVQIKLGKQSELVLGDLTAKRDWSFAGDFVAAMWQMLQQDQPGDYVLASGVQHTVSDLVNTAFGIVGLDPADYVRSDPNLVRKHDEADLVGDPSRIAERVGWRASTGFEELVQIMGDGFMAKAEAGQMTA